MGDVKSTPILRVALAPSRIASAAIGAATVATAALVALLPGEPGLRGAAVVVCGACGIRALRLAAAGATPRAIAAIELGVDRRAAFTERSGRRVEGVVQPGSYIGALLATLVLRPDGAGRSRAVAIFPDAMPVDDFRRLRVLLRHGEAASPDRGR